MEALVELSWRAYPGGALLALGLAVFVLGAWGMATGLRRPLAERPAAYMAGFRTGIIGLAIGGIAGAWVWQQLWVLVLALAIGGEELLESSIALYALRRGRRHAAMQG
jgi:hypothetical protein